MDIWKSWDGVWKIGSSSDRMEDQLVGCVMKIVMVVLLGAFIATIWVAWKLLALVFTYPKVGLPIVGGIIILLFVFVPALSSLFTGGGPATAAAPAPARQATSAPTSPPATQRPTVAPTVPPTPVRTALPQTYWVKNHKTTGMWSASGNPGDDGKPAVKFGDTSSQFCSFLVMLPQERSRLYVFNPYTNDYFWIDADAIGPTGQSPERRREAKLGGQNCAEAVYDGANLPRGAPEPR